MAKPFSVASSDSASSSNSTSHPHPSPACHTRRPRRRVAAAVVTAAHSLAPSATLLSLLSIVASSSVVAGSPAPPAFLCPSIGLNPTPTPTPTRRRYRREATSTSPSSTVQPSSVPRAVVQAIPDKYEPDDDGIWRRVDSYTFYGVCPSCTTSAVSAIDDQAVRPNDTTTSTTTRSTDIPDTLPPGWAPKTPAYGHESRTTLILAMSLVLAFFICFFIIGCLFWRKSLRRFRERDLERKGKARRRDPQVEGSEEAGREMVTERETRSKHKLWTRATARWKENARYTARQRRGKRSSIRSRTRRSSLSLDGHRDGLTSGRSSPAPSGSFLPSRQISRRGSTSSLQHELFMDTGNPQQEAVVPTISLSPPSVPPQSSPPAYQQKALRSDLSSDGLYPAEDTTSTSSLIRSRRPSRSSFHSRRSENDLGEMSSIPAAHVATDDKAVLARLADLASAPPSDQDADGSGHMEEVSAPEWRDEEMEEFMARSEEASTQVAVAAPPFPPPPSKGNLLSPNFYDYPYEFDEAGMEMDLGPSAPPFEETPSAPLVMGELDVSSLQPSAPPLMDDADFYVDDSGPGAPPDLHDAVDGQHRADEQHNSNSSHGATTDDTTSARLSIGGASLPDYHP